MPAPTSRTTAPTRRSWATSSSLNGVKTLISRVDEAQSFVVFSRVNTSPGREGIGCVLIERDTPGFECTARYHTMGGENLAEIQFDNCELPLENLIIHEDGFKKLLTAFNTQRCLNPSVSLGLAEGAFEEAVKYARDRTAFGRRSANSRACAGSSRRCIATSRSAASILYRACLTANPFPDPHLAAIAKIYCNEMAIRVTSEAIQVHGGYGFTDEYPGLALLPRRALRHARRRHDRDAEGTGRQEDDDRLPGRRLPRHGNF